MDAKRLTTVRMNEVTWLLYDRIKELDAEGLWSDTEIAERLALNFPDVADGVGAEHVEFIRALGDLTLERS